MNVVYVDRRPHVYTLYVVHVGAIVALISARTASPVSFLDHPLLQSSALADKFINILSPVDEGLGMRAFSQ